MTYIPKINIKGEFADIQWLIYRVALQKFTIKKKVCRSEFSTFAINSATPDRINKNSQNFTIFLIKSLAKKCRV